MSHNIELSKHSHPVHTDTPSEQIIYKTSLSAQTTLENRFIY